MITKAMGLADLAAAVILLFAGFLQGLAGSFAAPYLIGKGILFTALGDTLSILDLLCGIYAVFVAAGATHIVPTIICVLYLVQKSLASML